MVSLGRAQARRAPQPPHRRHDEREHRHPVRRRELPERVPRPTRGGTVNVRPPQHPRRPHRTAVGGKESRTARGRAGGSPIQRHRPVLEVRRSVTPRHFPPPADRERAGAALEDDRHVHQVEPARLRGNRRDPRVVNKGLHHAVAGSRRARSPIQTASEPAARPTTKARPRPRRPFSHRIAPLGASGARAPCHARTSSGLRPHEPGCNRRAGRVGP